MSSSHSVLRAQVLRAHLQYIPRLKELGLCCPGCNDLITDGWDSHEWLVKRSAVPKPKQHLIMMPVNVIPIHPECHNNSKELTRLCLTHLVPNVFTAIRIGMWYESLWRFNGLSVPKGNLIPPKDLSIAARLRMFNKGCKILRLEIDGWETRNAVDVRGCVMARWTGKTRGIAKPPKVWQGVPVARLYEAMATGYWMNYLEGVIG